MNASRQAACHAGNSYVESPEGKPELDELLTVEHYERTRQQQIDVGLLPGDDEEAAAPQVKGLQLAVHFCMLAVSVSGAVSAYTDNPYPAYLVHVALQGQRLLPTSLHFWRI